jgi:hypothetical protein
MKKLTLLLALPLLITACKPKAAPDAAAPKTDTVSYAYSIPKPDNWSIDTSNANTQTALKALKAFEKGDTAELHKYFTDTVEFNYDGDKFKGPLSKFLEMCKEETASLKSFSIKMTDWEPVISKDAKERWVTLWYTETMTGQKGKTDSVAEVNDFLFKDSKIVRIDEYQRHLK